MGEFMNWDVLVNVAGCISCFCIGFAMATHLGFEEVIEITEKVNKMERLLKKEREEIRRLIRLIDTQDKVIRMIKGEEPKS
jgi:hypothetical protein